MALEKDIVVSLHYELKEQGKNEIINTNIGGMPLEFMIGRGHIIPGLERQLLDAKKGEQRTIEVIAAEGYGEYNQKAVMDYPKEQFEGVELEVGMMLCGQAQDGQTVQVRVVSFDDKSVKVDYNHPLAGKDLVFDISIVDIRKPTQKEIEIGLPENMQNSCCCDSHDHHAHKNNECCQSGNKQKNGCCQNDNNKHDECCCGHDH